MKYDKMVELNRKKKEQNMEKVRKVLNDMLKNKKWITPTQLAKETGLERSYFYHNKEIYKDVESAMQKQRMAYDPDVVIMDETMEDNMIKMRIDMLKIKTENRMLEEKIKELSENNKLLEQELEKLIVELNKAKGK